MPGGLADYNHAIELKPDFAICYVNRGIVESKMRDPEDSNADFLKAIKLDATMRQKIEAKGYSVIAAPAVQNQQHF